MASNQTPNLALPLWEASDAILREDFNSMTQTLDAAVTAARSRIPLLSYTIPAQTAQHSVDLSAIDFTRWRSVTLHLTGLRGRGELRLYLNGAQRNVYNLDGARRGYLAACSVNSALPSGVTLTFYGGVPYTCVKAVCFTGSTGQNGESRISAELVGVTTDVSVPATLRTVDLAAAAGGDDGYLSAGAEVAVYGEPM